MVLSFVHWDSTFPYKEAFIDGFLSRSGPHSDDSSTPEC